MLDITFNIIIIIIVIRTVSDVCNITRIITQYIDMTITINNS